MNATNYRKSFVALFAPNQKKTMKTPFKLLMLAFSVLSFFNLNAQDNKKVVRLIDGESTIYTNNIALDFDDINNIDNVHITNTVNVIGNSGQIKSKNILFLCIFWSLV